MMIIRSVVATLSADGSASRGGRGMGGIAFSGVQAGDMGGRDMGGRNTARAGQDPGSYSTRAL